MLIGDRWTPLRAGRWNRVWLTGDRRTVVKSYADRTRAENEAAALRLLAGHDVPAPRLVAVRLDSAEPAVTMSALAGKTLDTDAAIAVAPEALRRVHAIRGGWYGRLAGAGRYPSWRAYLTARIALYLSHVDREPELRARLATDEFTGLVAGIEPSTGEPRLLHNDLHPAHFIDHPAGAALVDWEHSVFGDPLYDLARFGFRAGLGPHEVARLAGAGDDAAALLACYRRIALLAHVSLGVGRSPSDQHRVQCLRALAELTGDTEGTRS
jgi:aminoglycoside phosphotransferase (APT) family kinase protein